MSILIPTQRLIVNTALRELTKLAISVPYNEERALRILEAEVQAIREEYEQEQVKQKAQRLAEKQAECAKLLQEAASK